MGTGFSGRGPRLISNERILKIELATETEADTEIDTESEPYSPQRISKSVGISTFDSTTADENVSDSNSDMSQEKSSKKSASSKSSKGDKEHRSKSKDKKSSSDKKKSKQGEEEEGEEEGEGEGEGGGKDEGIYDYYDILNVEKDDPIEKVRENYRKEIVMAEFERHTDDGKERINEVCEAYYILTNESRRTLYDRTIEEENLDLVKQWKPKEKLNPDTVFAEVFATEIEKELFKPGFYFTPMSYAAGAVIGYVLASYPGIVLFTFLCGRVGDWEDKRSPAPIELVSQLTDNQRTALMHALSRIIF